MGVGTKRLHCWWRPIRIESDSQNVIGLDGYALDSSCANLSAANDGYVMIYVNGTSKWTPTKIGGDISGSISAMKVVRLDGYALDSSCANLSAANDGYVMTYVNGTSKWTPTKIGGDVSGTIAAMKVVQLDGYVLPGVSLWYD